jgi:hypothetical protein
MDIHFLQWGEQYMRARGSVKAGEYELENRKPESRKSGGIGARAEGGSYNGTKGIRTESVTLEIVGTGGRQDKTSRLKG